MSIRIFRLMLLTAPLLLLGGCNNEGSSGRKATIVGAGATFPAPLYEKWIAAYRTDHAATRITYQALGSGAGIEFFKEGKADFGASDVVPTDKQLEGVAGGAQTFPLAAGMVVVCCNLPEYTTEVKLSRAALVGIFQGEITSWDDPKIAENNKNMPKMKITIVHRAGASGTTFVFTQHLSAVSDTWKKGPGAGFTVPWPKESKRAMGNDGVADLIKQTPGAIGYLSFSAAAKSKLPRVALENKAGEMVAPSSESGKIALAALTGQDNVRNWVPDAEGKGAYPIVTFTWIIARKQYQDKNVADQLRDFLKYGLTTGQQECEALGYLPLPAAVVDKTLPEVERIGS
jgi:phosphate transport system substrate-binding protein